MKYYIESNNIIEKEHKRFTPLEELYWLYEAREKYKKDTATILAAKVREAEARAEARGKANTLHKVVINLRELKFPLEKIIKVTGLSEEDIKSIDPFHERSVISPGSP